MCWLDQPTAGAIAMLIGRVSCISFEAWREERVHERERERERELAVSRLLPLVRDTSRREHQRSRT